MSKSFTGEILKDTIENATGNSTWANDNQTIFYTRQDEKTLRSDKVLDIK
jgi:oligopeptidase B